MKIQKIINQNRRDFRAIYECEHCGFSHEQFGYDDSNFHENIIPKMVCPQCGLRASSDCTPKTTRYPDSQTV